MNIFNYFYVLNQLKAEKEAHKEMQQSVVINQVFLNPYSTSGGFEWLSTPSFFSPANPQPLSWEDYTMTKAEIANGWPHLFNQQASQSSFPSSFSSHRHPNPPPSQLAPLLQNHLLSPPYCSSTSSLAYSWQAITWCIHMGSSTSLSLLTLSSVRPSWPSMPSSPSSSIHRSSPC